MNGKGGLNRRISNHRMSKGKETSVEERLINFSVGHSLLDILRFISARNDRWTVHPAAVFAPLAIFMVANAGLSGP